MNRNYFKIMLGKKSMYAEECMQGNFIGADYGIHMDLTTHLTENWRDFNHALIPYYLRNNPGKSKIAAGLACGALWTISKGIQIGDIVICPNGHARFIFGEVLDNYSYHPGEILPHRRTVNWFPAIIPRSEVSQGLKSSTTSQGTIAQITQHAEEIDKYISGNGGVRNETLSSDVEDASVFALEKHLEDFLVSNWKQTDLGKNYDIYEEEGEIVGQQYPSDTGPIDILAISKDKKELLVVELKRGRVSDIVVGQIQRYMGYVKSELAEDNQTVAGIIIGLDDDLRIRRALSVTNNIEFYKYQISFKLSKG